MPFFRRNKGREKKNYVDRDRDWAKTAVGITGLRENFVWDGGIEEPYWVPSLNTGSLKILTGHCLMSILMVYHTKTFHARKQ